MAAEDAPETLWTYADLERRWRVGRRVARETCRQLGIVPAIRQHRTVRFQPAAVLRAETRAATESGKKPLKFAI